MTNLAPAASGFRTEPLTLTELPDDHGRLWRLEGPLTYQAITVRPGFVTDGASVPRWLWMALPAWGDYSRAAVVHDHLCALLADGRPHPAAPTRRAADAVFYAAMRESGVGLITRWVLWGGVRIGAVIHRLTGAVAPNTTFDADDTP